MGLDTTHGCWHGAYSAFSRWREKLAEVAKFAPLNEMAGYYPIDPDKPFSGQTTFDTPPAPNGLPRSWDAYKDDPLTVLLRHSDCDGYIPVEWCEPLAARLEQLIPLLPDVDAGGHIGNWRDKTQTFIDGLRRAAAAGEDVGFH